MENRSVTILGVAGSPRSNSLTLKAVQHFLETAETVPGVKTELINLANKNILPCIGCNACFRKQADVCPALKDDFDPVWMDLYRSCDAIVLASPIYQMNPTGVLYNFLSRLRPAGPSGRSGQFDMRFGTSIAIGGRRNGGQDTAVNAMNNQLQTFGVNIIGGGVMYYNGPAVWSQGSRELLDETGKQEIEVAARKLAYLTVAMRAGIEATKEELPLLGFAGFHTKEQQAKAYAHIGL